MIRRYFAFYILEIIAFVVGAATMILEIFGLSMIIPYFGSALTVTSNLIGIVLIGLAIGYWRGGIFADQKANPERLARVLFFSALWIGIVFPFRDSIAEMTRRIIPFISLGSFVATTILFLLPSVWLGMALPYAIKLHTQTISSSGRSGGRLYALSSLGSIGGTFFVGFFLIPHMGMSAALLILAIVLLLLAGQMNYQSRLWGCLPLFIVLAFAGNVFSFSTAHAIVSDGAVRFDRGTLKKLADVLTPYSRIQVYEGTDLETQKPIRLMRINGETHSASFLDSNELVFKYARFNRFGGHFNPSAKKALLIGGGAYSYANYFLGDTPLYDVEKIWQLDGKFLSNNKTISLPIITSNQAKKRAAERTLIYQSLEAPQGGAIEGTKNFLDAHNQRPGSVVIAKEADIFETGFPDNEGYVHVHEINPDGTLGKVISPNITIEKPHTIIGHSALISGANKNIPIPLDRATREGEMVYVMLHRDNDNKVFDPLLVDGYEQIENLDVVEIDKKTTELSQEFFHLNIDDPRLRVFHEDGRTYINRTKEKYDIIYLDAFRSFYSVPYQLATREATERLFTMLNDGGVLIANVPSSLSGRYGKFFQAEFRTYQSVFSEVRAYAVNDPIQEDKVQNVIIVAFKSPDRIRTTPNDDAQINEDLKNIWHGTIDPAAPILTDDFAPTDYFTNKFLNLPAF